MRWLRLGLAVVSWCALAATGLAADPDADTAPLREAFEPVTQAGEVGGSDAPARQVGKPIVRERPLHEVVDDLLAQASSIVERRLASDADFFRRLSLDLLGMPPTADEVRSFLSDRRPDKRERAVDRSLNDPRFARHLANFFSVMLLERRTSQFISADEWDAYLLRQLQENRPLNEIIREILAADGTDEQSRAAVQFYVAREANPHLITRDVGRIIFGRDMECAQCHDHPIVDDYLQRDYHALLAMFSGGTLVTKQVGDKQAAFYGDQPGKDDVYESVFIEGKHVTGPRLPGQATFEEPLLLPGVDREARAEHADVPRPVVSRREMLANAATDGTNRAFNENLANRLWAHMMGRGLVHPVDLHHSANPPTHPELLRVLGERLAAMNFNVRTFLRELALTQTYQASIDPPQTSEDVAGRAEAQQAKLQHGVEHAEALYDAAAAQYETVVAAFNEIEPKLLPVIEDYAAKSAALEAAIQKYREAAAAVSQAIASHAGRSEALAAVGEARDKAKLAVEKLAGDEAVAAAAKSLEERAAALAAEVDALQKAAQEKQAALEQIAAEQSAATAAAQAAAEVLAPLKQQSRELEAAMVVARERMMDDFAAYRRLEQQGEHAASVLAWHEARQQSLASTTSIAEREAALRQAEEQLASARQSVQDRTAALARTMTALDAATQSLAQVQLQATLNDTQADKLATARAAIHEVEGAAQQEAEAAKSELASVEAAAAQARAALEEAQSKASELAAATDEAWAALTDAWSADGTIRPLAHLSPEQMCWSMLQASGIYERTWRQEAAALDAEQPLAGLSRTSPFQWLERERRIEERTYQKLKGNLAQFVQLYGAGAGQPQSDFFASADQALFMSNGGTITSWASPADGNVTARMLAATEPAVMAEELYLSVLSRLPSPEEAAAVAQYVNGRPGDQRDAAVRELVWGLVTSAEFRFNH